MARSVEVLQNDRVEIVIAVHCVRYRKSSRRDFLGRSCYTGTPLMILLLSSLHFLTPIRFMSMARSIEVFQMYDDSIEIEILHCFIEEIDSPGTI